MNILGLDPGSRNFGYGVVKTRMHNGKHEAKVVSCGILLKPLTSIKPADLKIGHKHFVREIGRLMLPNSRVIGERFQTRGVKGVTIELINFMLAFVYSAYPNTEMRMVTASQWKHWVNKSEGLAKFVRKVKLSAKAKQTPLTKLYKLSACEPHELDAVLMTIFYSYSERNLVAFEDMTAKDWAALVSMCETNSTIEGTQLRVAKRNKG